MNQPIVTSLFPASSSSIMRHQYLLACVLPLLFPVATYADKGTEQYLSEGSNFLSSGKFNDAVISFDAAIRKSIA